jgi:transcriptional regulator of aromatic amino acid metabolism
MFDLTKLNADLDALESSSLTMDRELAKIEAILGAIPEHVSAATVESAIKMANTEAAKSFVSFSGGGGGFQMREFD